MRDLLSVCLWIAVFALVFTLTELWGEYQNAKASVERSQEFRLILDTEQGLLKWR